MQNITKSIYKLFLIFILTIILLITFLKYNLSKNNNTIIPVLMYHNIDSNIDFKKVTYTMKPDRFENHMRALKKKGYNTITATELNEYIYDNKLLPENPILITFDDGKTNNYEYAYPILKELKMKGTIFAIVHMPEEHNNKEYLDWKKLKEMYDNSVMDIQSHTYDFHYKINDMPVIFKKNDNESKNNYEKRVLDDFKISKKLIEKNIGNKVIALAYPYGGYNENIEKIAQKAGYKQTFTTDTGLMKKSDSPYLIKRLNVDGLCSERRLLAEMKLLELLYLFS